MLFSNFICKTTPEEVLFIRHFGKAGAEEEILIDIAAREIDIFELVFASDFFTDFNEPLDALVVVSQERNGNFQKSAVYEVVRGPGRADQPFYVEDILVLLIDLLIDFDEQTSGHIDSS